MIHIIIIDTNLWISFLITHNYDFLDKYILSDKVKLIFCKELLDEFIQVASRPKFTRFFSKGDIEVLFEILEDKSLLITIESEVTKCRDKKDDFLLALSADSKADFLITGDKDLLDIREFELTRIITIAEYKKILDSLSF